VGARRLTRLATVLLLGALAAGCRGGGEPATAPPDTTTTTATVEWVNDGDTLTLTDGRKVRLVQIDAPELATDCYGRSALGALVRLAPKGTRVSLSADGRLDDSDTHGRLLRYVFVGDTNVNVGLVRLGAAAPYFFRNERGRYADTLLDAADEARDARRGFWGGCPGAELNPGVGSITGPA
jgi:endonuclease YncB( thermonuclease family)